MSDAYDPFVYDLSSGNVNSIYTSRNNPRVVFDKTGVKAYDASGNPTSEINSDGTARFSGPITAQGVTLNEGTGPGQQPSSVQWVASPGGGLVASITAYPGNTEIDQFAPDGSYSQVDLQAVNGSGSVRAAHVDSGGTVTSALLIDQNGNSSFPFVLVPGGATSPTIVDGVHSCSSANQANGTIASAAFTSVKSGFNQFVTSVLGGLRVIIHGTSTHIAPAWCWDYDGAQTFTIYVSNSTGFAIDWNWFGVVLGR